MILSSLKHRRNFIFLRKNGDFYKFRYFYIQFLAFDKGLHYKKRSSVEYNLKHMRLSENKVPIVRVGITVTKSNYKTAVRRNNIRRRIKAALSEISIINILQNFPQGFDINFLIKPNFEESDYRSIVKDIESFLFIRLEFYQNNLI